MTAKQFDDTLKQLGLSRPAAAKALGLSVRTVTSYAHSRRKLPRWLELAVKGLVAERQSAQA
jgi:transcriptional regulator with XRE-family HTH domain